MCVRSWWNGWGEESPWWEAGRCPQRPVRLYSLLAKFGEIAIGILVELAECLLAGKKIHSAAVPSPKLSLPRDKNSFFGRNNDIIAGQNRGIAIRIGGKFCPFGRPGEKVCPSLMDYAPLGIARHPSTEIGKLYWAETLQAQRGIAWRGSGGFPNEWTSAIKRGFWIPRWGCLAPGCWRLAGGDVRAGERRTARGALIPLHGGLRCQSSCFGTGSRRLAAGRGEG